MSYQQASIPVPESLAELLSDALMEHGALSAAIEDALAGTENEQPIFGEPDMPQQQVWQQSLIIALFDEHADVARIIANTAASIPIQPPEYSLETLEEQDWVSPYPIDSLTRLKFPTACGLPPHGTMPPMPVPSTCA